MTGAIEFLQKAKEIYKSCKYDEYLKCPTCPIKTICGDGILSRDEADLVRKVMDYQINQSTTADRQSIT
jgi:hypothetical protein